MTINLYLMGHHRDDGMLGAQPKACRRETFLFVLQVCSHHTSVNMKIFVKLQVLDQSYEEIDIDVTKPMKLDLSVTENYTSKYHAE